MNRTIWKFKITPMRHFVEMPIGAEILTVQTQDDIPHIWALVNPENGIERRYIEVFGTGHHVPCDMGVERKYIGTFQMLRDSLVFHVFERIN